MNIQDRVRQFRIRIQKEPEFALELYLYGTMRVLMHKYLYYECGQQIQSDYAYDIQEQSWYVMHLSYGGNTDETSPCVGFDSSHPFSEAAKEAGEYWVQSNKCLK